MPYSFPIYQQKPDSPEKRAAGIPESMFYKKPRVS